MENRFEVLDEINNIKNTVGTENYLSFYSKDKQRQMIQEKIHFERLLQSSIYNIPTTNHIFIDYPILKLFANPNNYPLIVDNIISNINANIVTYDIFNIHININTFSVTACQRFLPIIRLFLEKCAYYNTAFSEKIGKLYIYNTPSSISNISNMLQPFIFPDLRKNIVLHDKQHSPELLSQLFSQNS
uniref:CRAL-TRIO domain-containing protein n=1 Tax=viral metagenome TaxID=1070528 RepID=A0A6C0DR69_9ZZZZ